MNAKHVVGILSAVTVVVLGGCHSISREATPSELSLSDHDLVGKIWHVKSKQFVDKLQLLNDIVGQEYVLLGETHDNPVHHNYQAWVITQLKMRGRNMSVAFEMLTPEQDQALAKIQIQTADQIFDAVQWENTGWPNRALYKPVFVAALDAGYAIHAANIDRQELNQIIMQGEKSLPENIKTQLHANPLSEESEELLRTGIVESHCQMLPDSMVPAMMLGQRVRDAAIANSVVTNKAKDGIVLIAGSGHTQKNGVPGFIRSVDNSAKIFTMAWMEVDKRLSNPEDYSEYWGTEELPFDYVWFTARIDRPDPCEELKKHHKFSKQE
ncbi:ChaN family lipoprotein [Kaarinaea lacus]